MPFGQRVSEMPEPLGHSRVNDRAEEQQRGHHVERLLAGAIHQHIPNGGKVRVAVTFQGRWEYAPRRRSVGDDRGRTDSSGHQH
jgi:hypothetical protein